LDKAVVFSFFSKMMKSIFKRTNCAAMLKPVGPAPTITTWVLLILDPSTIVEDNLNENQLF
jgi:hypothetical protein